MNKKDFLWRLENIIPGEKCDCTRLDPPKTSIYFKNINLNSLNEFNKYSQNEKLYEYFEFKPFKDIDDTLAYYKKMERRMKEYKSHYYWFIYTKEERKLIGSACLASINFERRSLEWGQGIDPSYWGLNYSLQVNEILKHYIFEVLSMNRIFGQTMIDNTRAIECVKASGCKFEGILRDFYKKDNLFIDAWMYSLLSKEYYQESSLKLSKKIKISLEEIIFLISEIITEENINEMTSMDNCLNWDSISHTSIISNISEKYNIKLSPIEFTQLTSVKLIFDYLNN